MRLATWLAACLRITEQDIGPNSLDWMRFIGERKPMTVTDVDVFMKSDWPKFMPNPENSMLKLPSELATWPTHAKADRTVRPRPGGLSWLGNHPSMHSWDLHDEDSEDFPLERLKEHQQEVATSDPFAPGSGDQMVDLHREDRLPESNKTTFAESTRRIRFSKHPIGVPVLDIMVPEEEMEGLEVSLRDCSDEVKKDYLKSCLCRRKQPCTCPVFAQG